jgi:hypothetical protein
MDFAWTAGGRLAIDRLLFEVRYDHGLRNLTDEATGASIKNRSVSFLSGWTFR